MRTKQSERQRPVHTHDCRGCEFLGRFDAIDVYQCDHIDLIMRYGDAESENKALPICVASRVALDRDMSWLKAVRLYKERHPRRAV